MPHPPMPCVIQIMIKGTKVGSRKSSFTWSRLKVLAPIVGACSGRSAMMASRSGSVRNFTVSGSVTSQWWFEDVRAVRGSSARCEVGELTVWEEEEGVDAAEDGGDAFEYEQL